jgi:hypothetical protein
MLKKLPYVIFVFIISSCSSTRPNETTDAADPISQTISKGFQNNCFSSNNPQLVTQFSSPNTETNFQFEGVWTENYTEFTMQVLGPFGETLALLKLNNNKLNVFSNREKILNNPEIKNLITFLSSIGSRQLRKVFCGVYAFREDKDQTSLFKFKNSDTKGFISKNEMDINNHNVGLDTDVSYSLLGDDKSMNITMDSQFLYGVLNIDTHLRILWTGTLGEQKIEPKKIVFLYGKNNYELELLDYN